MKNKAILLIMFCCGACSTITPPFSTPNEDTWFLVARNGDQIPMFCKANKNTGADYANPTCTESRMLHYNDLKKK